MHANGFTATEMKYLRLLSQKYRTIAEVSTEIINLNAIICLPKGTEHFISDIHGEYAAFLHMLKNASGVVREKIEFVFENTMALKERNALATLIYYPAEKLEMLHREGVTTDEWYRITLLRLVEICRVTASKYTRSKVRKALPSEFSYIIDELLNAAETPDKIRYNHAIIQSILDTEQGDAFIIAISLVIQRLVIDHLHVVGDIFDRGPGAHFILDALTTYHSVDVQWGNHDILWMGAAAGNEALIATAIINSLKYGNVDTIEDGYGISLSPLLSFAMDLYWDDPCTPFVPRSVSEGTDAKGVDLIAKMHKAMAVILFKLEGQIIERHPEYGMDHRRMLHRIDYESGTIELKGKVYPLRDSSFPTVLPSDPYTLTNAEQDLMRKLQLEFHHSRKLQEHVRFLFSRGSMYLVYNGNLLFHGCVPCTKKGSFTRVKIDGSVFRGKRLFDKADSMVRQGYFAKWNSPERMNGLDFMWYLWCGPDSPLFGKDQMTTFERYYIDDKSTHTETKNPYFSFAEHEDFAVRLLHEFGCTAECAYVVNGHVPVKIKKGESPLKANGKILVIDGGMSKAYQSVTGMAGYTLIASSRRVFLSCHEPFVTVEEAVRNEVDIHSIPQIVYQPLTQRLVGDTDIGTTLKEQIADLKKLLHAYQSGIIKEHR